VCVSVCVELLLLLLSSGRRGTKHALVVVGAELLLLSNYCRRGNMHACECVSV